MLLWAQVQNQGYATLGFRLPYSESKESEFIILAFSICCQLAAGTWSHHVSLIWLREIFLTADAYNIWEECGKVPAHNTSVLTAGASLSKSHCYTHKHTPLISPTSQFTTLPYFTFKLQAKRWFEDTVNILRWLPVPAKPVTVALWLSRSRVGLAFMLFKPFHGQKESVSISKE